MIDNKMMEILPDPDELNKRLNKVLDIEKVLKDIAEKLHKKSQMGLSFLSYTEYGFSRTELYKDHEEIIKILKKKGYRVSHEVSYKQHESTCLKIRW